MRLELTLEQEAFRTTVEAFASDSVRPQAAAIDTSDRFPRELVQQAGALGLMGLSRFPRRGAGRGATTSATRWRLRRSRTRAPRSP